MKVWPVISRILKWYKSKGLFVRPSRQLPGQWRLFEYYTEPEGQLLNMKEDQLIQDQLYWELNFKSHGQFGQRSNLPVQFLGGSSQGTWDIFRNFIVLLQADGAGQKEEIQFAVVNGNLRLLKKDRSGRIEFFGFFRKINTI